MNPDILAKRFDASDRDWFFATGPAESAEDWLVSFCVYEECAEIATDAVAQTFLSHPNVTLAHPATPDWRHWKAKWKKGGDNLRFDMCDAGFANSWGGSYIDGDCTVGDLLDIWHHLLSTHPGVWLHYGGDCSMFTPSGFAAVMENWEP